MNIVYHTMVYMYKVKAHILPCVYFCYTKHMQVVRKIRSFRFFFLSLISTQTLSRKGFLRVQFLQKFHVILIRNGRTFECSMFDQGVPNVGLDVRSLFCSHL